MSEGELLGAYTTLGVGGPAAEMRTATTRAELVDAVLESWSHYEDPFVLGGGSNVVVSDEGYAGMTVLLRTRGIERLDAEPGRVRLLIEAGEDWDGLVAHTVAAGWSGIEALSGIPGSVGAAPIQNIGAYGQELSSVLVAVHLLDRSDRAQRRVPAAELGLGYRRSVLKRFDGQPPVRDAIVVAIEIELSDRAGLGEPLAFPQLAQALGAELGAERPVAEVREHVLALRRSKGMVFDAADPDSRSAGSFFTNPIVPAVIARGLPPEAPRWPVPTDSAEPVVIALDRYDGSLPERSATAADEVKLSAAWLIEHAGVSRGFALPGSRAAISSKHTLALTNRGGATAEQVLALARYVQARVQSEFGVGLVPEPVVVGFEE